MICAPTLNQKLKEFCIHPGVSEIVFLKKPHKWTEELRIGQGKVYCMEYCDSGTPRPANKVKMADRQMKLQETQLPLDVAQHCSVFC